MSDKIKRGRVNAEVTVSLRVSWKTDGEGRNPKPYYDDKANCVVIDAGFAQFVAPPDLLADKFIMKAVQAEIDRQFGDGNPLPQ